MAMLNTDNENVDLTGLVEMYKKLGRGINTDQNFLGFYIYTLKMPGHAHSRGPWPVPVV